MQMIKWDKSSIKKLQKETQFHLDKDLYRKVQRIIWDVKEKGDLAIKKYTRDFDGLTISPKKFRVSESEINRAYEKVSYDFVPLIKYIQNGVQEYYDKDRVKDFLVKRTDGVTIGKQYRPLDRVGVYIPGGQAPLVSTVYMTVIPALMAGVKQIVLATPPNRDSGEIDPHILVVANLLGVKEIYRMGGAQAIAALAFGTRTIGRVDKIIGPGNPYVTEAKRQVYGFVDIDMVAGPSEICIIADASANPDFITCDLLAQTEHFGGVGYLITNSAKQIERVLKRVDTGYVIKVASMDEACEACNLIAPEHVEVMTKDPEACLAKIENAGAIFLGPNSPAVLGDYVAGPSHVLPTAGTARYFSPLSSMDFMKSSQIINFSEKALGDVRSFVRSITEMERMVLHRISLEARFSQKDSGKGIETHE